MNSCTREGGKFLIEGAFAFEAVLAVVLLSFFEIWLKLTKLRDAFEMERLYFVSCYVLQNWRRGLALLIGKLRGFTSSLIKVITERVILQSPYALEP